MRITLPEFNSKSELHNYLRTNKKTLIDQKKSMPIFSDVCVSLSTALQTKGGTGMNLKGNLNGPVTPVMEDVDILRVKVVANAANFIDSYFDMLLAGAATKSINERKAVIPHLHDHIHQVGAKVGEVVDIYPSVISLMELGLDMQGSTEGIIFITDVMKAYNEKVFMQYKMDRVNQHSIGLQYVQLELAINDPDSEKEFNTWNKYYPLAINKKVADEWGFFWVAPEYKLIENSAVLFGANMLTPTLDNNVKFLGEPEKSTLKTGPSPDTQAKLKMYDEILNLFNK